MGVFVYHEYMEGGVLGSTFHTISHDIVVHVHIYMIALLSLHSDEILYFGAYKIFVTHLSRDSCCCI